MNDAHGRGRTRLEPLHHRAGGAAVFCPPALGLGRAVIAEATPATPYSPMFAPWLASGYKGAVTAVRDAGGRPGAKD